MPKKERENQSLQGSFLLLTDEREHSKYWFEGGVRKALDGYASSQMVGRKELEKMIQEGKNIEAIIIDSVYTNDWKSYLPKLSERGVKVVVAAASPIWEDARDAFMNGATDYFSQTLVAGDLRHNLLSG